MACCRVRFAVPLKGVRSLLHGLNALCCRVFFMQSCATYCTLLLENMSLFRTTAGVLALCFSFYFHSVPHSISIRSFLNVSLLHYICFTDCMQFNQQLALSRLMRHMHCDCTLFPYQAPERRQTQGFKRLCWTA